MGSLSVAEVSRNLLIKQVPPTNIPGGVIYGPPVFPEIKLGLLMCQESGYWKVDPYVRIEYPRVLVRCLAPTMEQADSIKSDVLASFQDFTRTPVRQDSTGENYLVYTAIVRTGPTFGIAEQRNFWEMRLVLELMISSEACDG